MSDCKCECSYISIIIGIVFGVVLGVLYSVGLAGTEIIFPLYLAIGVAGLFIAPIYGFLSSFKDRGGCFCRNKNMLLVFSAGTVITGAAGLIVSVVDSITAIATAVAVATFFAVTLLSTLVCLARGIKSGSCGD